MGSIVAGVDCSTQATKVVLVDADTGLQIASARRPNPVRRDGGVSETDPDAWWHALIDALAETGRASEIRAISVAAQMLGLVTLAEDRRPVRPAILWDDTRSANAAEALRAELGGPEGWAAIVGTQPLAGLTATSWAWLRGAEPDAAARTAFVLLPHDFLTERLTGERVTDRGDASGTGWWSSRRNTYANEVLSLERIALSEDMLPRVLGPEDSAGSVTRAAAGATGLTAGIPVACGTGDNMAAALALAVDPGTPVISLGTSGTAYVRSAIPPADTTGQVFADASASGDHLPLTCTLNATLAVDNLARLLGLGRDDVSQSTRAVVMPYLSGERLPDYPRARGTIAGIDHATTAGEILLAAYEGVAYSLVESISVLDRHSSGIPADAPIMLVGGGARGAIWQATIARLSGRRLIVPDRDELVAWGAAAQAAGLLRGVSGVSVAKEWQVSRGTEIPSRNRDEETVERIARVRTASNALNESAVFA